MKRLLIRPGAIGDFIVSLPALESLRASDTEVWCPSAVQSLAWFADRTVSLPGSGIDRVGLRAGEDVLARMREFDEIHSWYGTNHPEFREACSGLSIRFHAPLPDSKQHAVDFYLSQTGESPGAIPALPLHSAPKRGCAILHPFSGSAPKNWPLAEWHRLAHLLRRRMPVEWCCGPEDSLPGAVVIPNLMELAQWLHSARVFIGNDSGISHLAAAAGTPVIALFGPTDPAIWAPRGPHVTVIHRDAWSGITAEMVCEAVI